MDGAYIGVTEKPEVMVPCFQRERGEKGENGEQKEKTITKCSFPRNFFRSFHFSSPSLRAANEPQWKWKRSRDNGVISSNPGKKKNLSERLWIYCATSQHWFFCPPAFHLIINPGPAEPAEQIGSSLICFPRGNQPVEQIGS